MRYLRKYKLYESVKDIFKKLPIEESDISDILIDLTDNGYNIKYKSFFLSDSGKTYEDNKGIGNYYPVILISIKRDKKYKEDGSNDVRHWDGSLYFEDSDSVLESIYHSISRLRHTLSDYKLYYNIRNINEIYIRIIFDKEKQDDFNLEFAMKEYRKLIGEYCNIDGLNGRYDETNFMTFYEVEEGISTQSRISIDVSPIRQRHDNVDILNPRNILSHIMQRSVVRIESDNKGDLLNFFKIFIDDFVKKLNTKYSVKVKHNGSSVFRIYNSINKDTYIVFHIDYEPINSYKVLTKEGGFMRKDQYKDIRLYKLDVDATFKVLSKKDFKDIDYPDY